jgi:MoxR-like ATPase
VSPDDVQEIYADVLRHRILLSYEAEADGWTQIKFFKNYCSMCPFLDTSIQVTKSMLKDRHRRYSCRFCT